MVDAREDQSFEVVWVYVPQEAPAVLILLLIIV
jgi:hypothetical protein